MESPSVPVVVRARPRNIEPEAGGLSDEPRVLEIALSDVDSQEKTPGIQAKGGHSTQAVLVPVKQKDHLGLMSTTALIVNKIIGTGIYVSPQIVLSATGSKGVSLMIWIAGCIMTWAGLYIYLEYGMRWPVTGGELYYVDNVFSKPRRLLTYIFASMFILVNGVQGNALQFGKEVIIAISPSGTIINNNLEKLFAILIITFVCQIQAYSRAIYVRISNILAAFKIFSLCFITVCGLVALIHSRGKANVEIPTPYGKEDFTDAFSSVSKNPYQYGLALLSVMRSFLGYENANFVLAEVRAGPKEDERRIFRRAVKASVLTTCCLYIMVNVAFFAVCTKDEIINAPDTLSLFFQKVFGESYQATIGSAVIIAFSAAGSVIALTFANVRVKQEISRMGLVPIPEFWSKTSHRRTPAHALFLHWIFSVICIVITPLSNPAGFLIMSTLYSYLHTYIGILLGVGLLCAPWIKSFQFNDKKWEPESSLLKWKLLAPLAVIYVLSNAFVLILSWFPANLQSITRTTEPTLPYYTGPVTGLGIIAFGIMWWGWDTHILPFFGYHFHVEEYEEKSEKWGVDIFHLNFYRKLDDGSLAERVVNFCSPTVRWLWKYVSREPAA